MSEKMRDALDWLNEIVTNPNGWRRFYSVSETKTCAEATLAMLKEQDAVRPVKQIEQTEWTVCGNCRNHIISKWIFCPNCGKSILWGGR